ncbi:MAG: hypothetical protein U0R52_06345 [Solirubrobacterales bacterium]
MATSPPDQETSRFDLAGIIYGIILATALIGAFSEQDLVGPVATFVAVMGSAVVFWLAHAYAHIVASGVVTREATTMAEVRESLTRQVPLVLGALPPSLVLLLTPVGLLSESNSQSLAMLAGIAMLTAFGFFAARRQGVGVLGTLILTATSAGLGIIIVALKSAVH